MYVYIYICVCMFVCVYVCVYVYIYIYIYIYMCVCICVCGATENKISFKGIYNTKRIKFFKLCFYRPKYTLAAYVCICIYTSSGPLQVFIWTNRDEKSASKAYITQKD